MKKKHVQSVDLGVYGTRRSTGKKVSPQHKSSQRKEVVEVYNRFYKDQVMNLWKAIRSGR